MPKSKKAPSGPVPDSRPHSDKAQQLTNTTGRRSIVTRGMGFLLLVVSSF